MNPILCPCDVSFASEEEFDRSCPRKGRPTWLSNGAGLLAARRLSAITRVVCPECRDTRRWPDAGVTVVSFVPPTRRSGQYTADVRSSDGQTILRTLAAIGNHPQFGKWIAWLSSVVLIAVVLFVLRTENFATIAARIPRSPTFWIVFAVSYLTAPFADWIIFRRLWALGPCGFAPLLRKSVLNALLVSYAGEAYFFAWARARVETVARNPFGAIKDVAILSALAGNVTTLILVIAAWPMLKLVHLGNAQIPLVGSIALLTAISAAAIIFRARVFHLTRNELVFVTAVHIGRTIISAGLIALLWHLAMPAVALQWWLLLSTGRMVVSRLPLIANKDLAFAGVAALVFQNNLAIVELMAMTAMLVFTAHVASFTGLLVNDLKRSRVPKAA